MKQHRERILWKINNSIPSSFYIRTPSCFEDDREAYPASPPRGLPLSQCAQPLPYAPHPQSPTRAFVSGTSAVPSPRRASESRAPSSGISQQHPFPWAVWTERCTATPPPEPKTLGFSQHPFSPHPARPFRSATAESPALESKFDQCNFIIMIFIIN